MMLGSKDSTASPGGFLHGMFKRSLGLDLAGIRASKLQPMIVPLALLFQVHVVEAGHVHLPL